MIKFNIKKYDYVDSKITGEVQRFRINAPNEKSTFPAGKGKWGLLDWRGEVLVEAIYDKINPFKEHLALTKKGKKYGYLDDRGKIAINFIYDNATDFKNGIALVEKSGISFYIDYLGEKIKKPKFKNEDENKAEIISFKPLWYKKQVSSVKFKTKAAAISTEENETLKKFFDLADTHFKNITAGETSLSNVKEFPVKLSRSKDLAIISIPMAKEARDWLLTKAKKTDINVVLEIAQKIKDTKQFNLHPWFKNEDAVYIVNETDKNWEELEENEKNNADVGSSWPKNINFRNPYYFSMNDEYLFCFQR